MNLICFSHLRWNFVFQRPQHLLTRFARLYRVIYIEEPVTYEGNDSYLIHPVDHNIWTVTLQLNIQSTDDLDERKKKLVDHLLYCLDIQEYICWYYTPMVLPFTKHLKPELTVYDCMDELSNFKFAPPELKKLEDELFKKADIVFTGGHSLYQAKKNQHHNIYPFPSSIDKEHFGKARKKNIGPDDQKNIPYPRIGFCGVIDERLDIELLKKVATKKPDWHFILIGPVVKIHPSDLPANSNIHYLRQKNYEELPQYISNWHIAMIPFAINDATRYISPTKTPEYLSAGKPVISTPIKDIVEPYGISGLVSIVHTAETFIAAVEKELNKHKNERVEWLKNVDDFLSGNSWDKTWASMNSLIKQTIQTKTSNMPKLISLPYVNASAS